MEDADPDVGPVPLPSAPGGAVGERLLPLLALPAAGTDLLDQQQLEAASVALVVATDYRSTLLRRAFGLLGSAQGDVEAFLSAVDEDGDPLGRAAGSQPAAVAGAGPAQDGQALVVAAGARTRSLGDGHGLALAAAAATAPGTIIDLGVAAVESRTATTRRAVDVLAAFQRDIEQLLGSIEQQVGGGAAAAALHGASSAASSTAAPAAHGAAAAGGAANEDVLRLAAATTSAAARFRVRAAEVARMALQAYEASLEQVRRGHRARGGWLGAGRAGASARRRTCVRQIALPPLTACHGGVGVGMR